MLGYGGSSPRRRLPPLAILLARGAPGGELAFPGAVSSQFASTALTLRGDLRTKIVRPRKPTPTTTRTNPIKIENSATCSARKAVLSAVVNDVAVTHRLRAWFCTGRLFSSLAAAASSFVSSPVGVRYLPISA